MDCWLVSMSKLLRCCQLYRQPKIKVQISLEIIFYFWSILLKGAADDLLSCCSIESTGIMHHCFVCQLLNGGQEILPKDYRCSPKNNWPLTSFLIRHFWFSSLQQSRKRWKTVCILGTTLFELSHSGWCFSLISFWTKRLRDIFFLDPA